MNISESELSFYEFACLFDAFYTWNELISLDIRGMFKEGEDEKEVIDYMNDIVRHGCLPSLQKLGINRNVHWNRLEKLFLVDCKNDALRNIFDGFTKAFQRALCPLCIKSFRGYNADIVCTLSQPQTCIPALNMFSEELVCVSKSVVPAWCIMPNVATIYMVRYVYR